MWQRRLEGPNVGVVRAAIDSASPEQLRELIRILIERITVTEDGDYEIEPVPAAWPFFAASEGLLLAPPDGRRGTRGKAPDPLAWYALR